MLESWSYFGGFRGFGPVWVWLRGLCDVCGYAGCVVAWLCGCLVVWLRGFWVWVCVCLSFSEGGTGFDSRETGIEGVLGVGSTGFEEYGFRIEAASG